MDNAERLSTEAVEGAALALEGVDDVEGGDGLTAGVLRVGDGVTDHVLKEDLEHTAGLLIDEAADALDTTTASQAADGGLGDALDGVAEDTAVALGSALSEALASLSTSGHDAKRREKRRRKEEKFCFSEVLIWSFPSPPPSLLLFNSSISCDLKVPSQGERRGLCKIGSNAFCIDFE